MFGRPAIMVVNLILGIVIICTKEKITKLFGAAITIGSIVGILDGLYQFGLRLFGSAGTVVTFANVYSYMSIALGIASEVFLYLYVKNRYGTKLITGIILLIGGNTMSTVIAFIVGRFITPDSFDNPSQFSYFLFSITTIFMLAFPIAWLIIFLKNRHKENELKLLWFERAITVAEALFSLILNIYMFFALNGTTSVRDLNIAQVNIEKYQIIGVLVFAVLNLLMSIYVVAKGRKAPKDLEPEVA
jgi:hypothetical protein